MNSRNDTLSPREDVATLPPSRALSSRTGTRRRRAAGIVAGFAVVGFATAIVAPTGLALAAHPDAAAAESAYSVALGETQDLTVTVDGAAISPIARGAFSVYVTPKPTPTPTPQPASKTSTTKTPRTVGGPVQYTGGGAPADWMAAAGIAQSDWGFVDYIVRHESGWNPNATNRSSGACGLVQALPCSKVPGNGYNPVDNLRWGTGYATRTYGSWADAYAFWVSNRWW